MKVGGEDPHLPSSDIPPRNYSAGCVCVWGGGISLPGVLCARAPEDSERKWLMAALSAPILNAQGPRPIELDGRWNKWVLLVGKNQGLKGGAMWE